MLITSRMRVIYALSVVLLLLNAKLCESSGSLRASNEDTVSTDEQERELRYYVGGKMYPGNSWYTDYKPQQIPRDWNRGDNPDYYRNGDECYKNGTIKRSNCPAPPNCNFTGKHGKAKLCINRLPTPGGKWYVAAMGCIPHFENCDKCICGTMVGSGKKARCHLNLEMDPDDDKVKVNCYELSKFEMDGHTVHVGKDL